MYMYFHLNTVIQFYEKINTDIFSSVSNDYININLEIIHQ